MALAGTYRLLNVYSSTQRSQQALLELDRYLSDLKDIETTARGYAVTRDERFLEPYRSATADLERTLARLHALAASERVLAVRLPALDRAGAERLAAAKTLVGLAAAGAPQSEVTAATLQGKRSMDSIRRQTASAIAAEQRVYDDRRNIVERQAIVASSAMAAGVAAALVVLVWLFTRLNRQVARRREAENELRTLNLELENRVEERTADVQRARDLLDAVVENLPDMILLKEPSGDGYRYLLVNAAGEALLGRDRGEILGRTEHEVFPAGEAAAVIKANRSVTRAGKARTFRERKLTTPSGVRTVETRMVPISHGNGTPALILAIVRDVSDARSQEEQLRQLQRMDAIGRLTGGVAHDFNNLLAVIMGSVELLCEQVPPGSEAEAVAEEALEATRRGADLVRRLLAFARKQHLEATAVDLNDRLPAIIPLLQRTLGESIRVQVQSADRLWEARIDATQVDDALVNLAINARDAMPDGGTLTIETANVVLDEDYAAHHVEVHAGEYVMLAVSDTGSGMPEEVAARAFEPFFTTKEEGRGTGLGLSQVFGWVKQSGGHIKIYSELGHGTTVKLYLPRALDGDRPVEESRPDEAHIRGSETILVVEDNPSVRRTALRQLTDLGYATIEAADGEGALEQIRSGAAFDLLLTDVVMPGGMSGYDLAEEAGKIRPAMRVLFTSGYTELAATGLKTARHGPLISKPYTKRELGQAIRLALDGQESGSADG
ncbi:MAG TPA: CHASE3 domain-containing protein [Sphingomicrobium sp.]|nr:CHASE3 domain-containing protein [Sphingomicrobium sp.]